MAVNFVQSTTGSSSGAVTPVVSTAFSSPVALGNLIVVTTGDDSGTTTGVTGVTDSNSNTYTQILTTHGTASLQMWYANNVIGGSGMTVSVSWNTGNTAGVTFVAQEFSGLNPLNVLDVSTFGAATTTATPSSGATPSTSLAVELVVAGGVHTSTNSAWTAGTGFSNIGSVDITNRSVAQASKVVTNVGAQTGTFTIGTSVESICAVATFKAKYVSAHISVGDGMSRSEIAN